MEDASFPANLDDDESPPPPPGLLARRRLTETERECGHFLSSPLFSRSERGAAPLLPYTVEKSARGENCGDAPPQGQREKEEERTADSPPIRPHYYFTMVNNGVKVENKECMVRWPKPKRGMMESERGILEQSEALFFQQRF